MMAEIDILNGFVGKVISDCIDITVEAIKRADKNRKAGNQTMEARMYQVTIDALNEFPYNKYKKKEQVYDAAESILKGFKSEKNAKEAVRMGLKIITLQATDDTCKVFLETLHHEICKNENDVLYKEIEMLWRTQTNGNLKKITQNQEEQLGMLGVVKEDIEYIREILDDNEIKHYSEIYIENRAKEYADKWDNNVFLNDFDEEDENAGINIKLRDLYEEICLPHYIWKTNAKPSNKLRNLLKKYTVDNVDKKMLLIFGQPGIGKSTLITWIMANLIEKKDDIFVYQFASDLRNVNWQGNDILNDILKKLNLRYGELENKILVLDGFDEVRAGDDREKILNQIYRTLKGANYLKKFSLIITCRENYVYKLNVVNCDFITLQAWDSEQIQNFCETYGSISKCNITENMIDKILDNKKILGIPLILYMVLALNITIEENRGIIDVYDQIFSLERGGMYDRCIRNSEYGDEHIIISEASIKCQIHQISQKIAFWIFENNSEKAFITQKAYEEICNDVTNEMSKGNEDIKRFFLIGNYFKLVKHCEGIGTDELQFVHRSIYEYFVGIYFFESLHNLKTKEEVAGKLGQLLKDGRLSRQILEFIKYKFDSLKEYNLSDITREVFIIMLRDGMTYHVKGKYKNIIVREMNIFFNMLEVVHLWNSKLEKLDNIVSYLQHNYRNTLNLIGADLIGADLIGAYLREAYLREADLSGADLIGADLRRADLIGAYLCGADLRGADLSGADLRRAHLSGAHLSGVYLKRADLSGVDLSGVDLRRADLRRADLIGAYLREADLSGADLRGADLSGADLSRAYLDRAYLGNADLSGANLSRAYLGGAYLSETVISDNQVNWLCKEYDLTNSRVYISETEEIISYMEYYDRKQRHKV